MNTATEPELGTPMRPPWSTSHVPAGVFTVALGSGVLTAGPPAIAVLVAVASAWITGRRAPSSGVPPESSAKSGAADDDALTSSPDGSSSITFGALGSASAD